MRARRRYRIVGDPTEGALIVAAAKAGAYRHDMKKAYPRESEVPFDSERKRMITVHDVKNPQPGDPSPFYDKRSLDWDVIAMKGAPDVVLSLCTQYQGMDDTPRPLTEEMRAHDPGCQRCHDPAMPCARWGLPIAWSATCRMTSSRSAPITWRATWYSSDWSA